MGTYLVCSLSVVSVGRFTASLLVERVFIGAAPAYVCVVCLSPFLYPGGGTDRWRRAVHAGVIIDHEATAFNASVPERRCAVSGGSDTNGVSLGTCLSCYRLHPGVGKRRGQACGSLLHPPLSTSAVVKSRPGPACLPFLWDTSKARSQLQLPPAGRENVCSGCKSKAEKCSREARRPPSQPDAVGAEPSAELVFTRGPALTVKPDSGTVPELLSNYVRQSRPDEIAVKFSNGRTRTYRRVVTAVKPKVSTRQDRRRRAETTALVSARLAVSPTAIAAAMSAVYKQAQESHGVFIAPFNSLSVRQQTKFKVANRISSVTWSRIRAFLGGRSSGLASREALRKDMADAASEEGAQVTADSSGAFLVSPRAAVQGLLDHLVAGGGFLECPIGPMSRSSSKRHGATDATGDTGQACPPRAGSGAPNAPAVGVAGPHAPLSGMGANCNAPSGSDQGAADVHPIGSRPDGSSPSPDQGVGGGPTGGDAHTAAKPPIHLCFGMDKGGHESTVKVWLGIANQRCPSGAGASILLGIFPCRADDYPALKAMSAVWLPDIEELRANGLRVGTETREVKVILTGDYSWLTAWSGHSGPSSRMPCLWCTALAQGTATNALMLTRFGCIQDGSLCGGQSRTTEHATAMRSTYRDAPNAALPKPLAPDGHLSIERRPLMVVPAEDTAPMPLHLTLGITVWLLQLAVECVIYANGEAAGATFSLRLGNLLRSAAKVAPAPYFGGGFEGKECHRIGRQLMLVCDLLASHAQPRHSLAFRLACQLWQHLLPTLNRAAVVCPCGADEFESRARSFVDGLKDSFEWVRITPKLHVLCCHAPEFLRRFGSLGRYGEQGLEALHGRFNRDAALSQAPTFLGQCREFVKRSAIGGAPGDAAHNNGERRRPAAPGARSATRTDDRRLRATAAAAGSSPLSGACRDKAALEMDKWAGNLTTQATTRIRTHLQRVGNGGTQVAAHISSGADVDDGLLSDSVSDIMMGLLGWGE